MMLCELCAREADTNEDIYYPPIQNTINNSLFVVSTDKYKASLCDKCIEAISRTQCEKTLSYFESRTYTQFNGDYSPFNQDVLGNIISYLPMPSCFMNFILVCQAWRSVVCESLFPVTNLSMTLHGPNRSEYGDKVFSALLLNVALLAGPEYFRRLTKIESNMPMSKTVFKFFSEMLKLCTPTLDSVDFTIEGKYIHEDHVAVMELPGLSSCRTLRCTYYAPVQFDKMFPHLRHLKLTNDLPTKSKDKYVDFSSLLSLKLESLCLCGFKLGSQLDCYIPSLNSLSIINCTVTEPEIVNMINSIASTCRRLTIKVLKVPMHNLYDIVADRMGKCVQHLSLVQLDAQKPTLQHGGMQWSTLQKFFKLHYLHISHFCDDDIPKGILPTIKSITLDQHEISNVNKIISYLKPTTFIAPCAIVTLKASKSLRHVQKLKLAYNDQNICRLLQHMPHIRSFSMLPDTEVLELIDEDIPAILKAIANCHHLQLFELGVIFPVALVPQLEIVIAEHPSLTRVSFYCNKDSVLELNTIAYKLREKCTLDVKLQGNDFQTAVAYSPPLPNTTTVVPRLLSNNDTSTVSISLISLHGWVASCNLTIEYRIRVGSYTIWGPMYTTIIPSSGTYNLHLMSIQVCDLPENSSLFIQPRYESMTGDFSGHIPIFDSNGVLQTKESTTLLKIDEEYSNDINLYVTVGFTVKEPVQFAKRDDIELLQEYERDQLETYHINKQWVNRKSENIHVVLKHTPCQFQSAVDQVREMVSEITFTHPLEAVQFLSPDNHDQFIRNYAVSALEFATNEDIESILAEFVHALEDELYDDSHLSNFILTRSQSSESIRKRLLSLIWFAREQPRFKSMYQQLQGTCDSGIVPQLLCIIHDINETRRGENISIDMEKYAIPLIIRLPFDDYEYEEMIIVEKDRNRGGAFLKLQFNGEQGESTYFIIPYNKTDELADQLVNMVSKMWSNAGLPFITQNFVPIRVSHRYCMVKALPDSVPISKVSRDVKSMLQPDYLAKYLQEHNTNYEEAQKRFMYSFVPYSLLCYVFNIQDRHNDNIHLRKNGELFHTGFKDLVYERKKFGIKRERPPFVFNDQMQYICTDHDEIARLMDIALNVLRENKKVLIAILSRLYGEDASNLLESRLEGGISASDLLRQSIDHTRNANRNLFFLLNHQ